jgi:hypothetical protein
LACKNLNLKRKIKDNEGKEWTKKEEMNPAYFFMDKNGKPLSLWAKCKDCGKWNIIREGANSIQNLPSLKKLLKPIIQRCTKCGEEKGILVERGWHSRKGMKEPTDC